MTPRAKQRGDGLRRPPEEVVRLTKRANAGDSEAAFKLFLHYDIGLRDPKRGNYWLKLAARLGSPEALETISAIGSESVEY